MVRDFSPITLRQRQHWYIHQSRNRMHTVTFMRKTSTNRSQKRKSVRYGTTNTHVGEVSVLGKTMVKVLVAGDVCGALGALEARVRKLNASAHGPFDVVFAVGGLFAAEPSAKEEIGEAYA